MVTVTAAGAFLAVLVVMMMFMLMLVVMMMLMTSAGAFLTVLVVVMLMLMLVVMLVMMGGAVRLLQLTKLVLHRVAVLHCGKDLLSVQLIPRRCDNGRTFVMLTQKRKASL